MGTGHDSARSAQGWIPDPFGLHDLRYFSQGQPTNLVRDGSVDSYDEPPPGEAPSPTAIAPDEPLEVRHADQLSDDIWRFAKQRYSLVVTKKSGKAGAGIVNWTVSLLLLPLLESPVQVVSTSDVVSLLDAETGSTVLRRKAESSEVAEIRDDLDALSVAQFQTKWGIHG